MCPGYVDRRHLPVTQYQWILCPFLYINYNGEMSRERLGPRLELSINHNTWDLGKHINILYFTLNCTETDLLNVTDFFWPSKIFSQVEWHSLVYDNSKIKTQFSFEKIFYLNSIIKIRWNFFFIYTYLSVIFFFIWHCIFVK